MLRRLYENSFVRFVFVGGLSTVLDMTALYLLVEYAHTSVFVAASIGFLIGTINGFALNKLFTFQNKNKRVFWQYTQYFIMAAIALGLTLLLMKFFIAVLLFHYLVAKVFTVLIVLIWTFSANKFIIFKH